MDTNVLGVSNGEAGQASVECQLRAIEYLLEISRSGSLVLDEGGEIIAEYRKHCSYAGQPGVGDEFFRWVVDNRYALRTVVLEDHPDRRFEEFPDGLGLDGFDWDDRIYVAVSITCNDENRIVNAIDSDYREAQAELDGVGVAVLELCPADLKAR